MRKGYGLERTDIANLSDRQLRRIENEGIRPGISTLAALAKAHKLELNAYLNELAGHLNAL